MAANLWLTGTQNAFNTTINGSIGSGDVTIPLTSVLGIQAPGVLVLDRQDANGNNTPVLREYISFTGISSNNITGCVRGVANSTAQSHASGAKVEECFSVTHWNDHITALLNILTSAGVLDTTKVVDLSTSQTLSNKILSLPNIVTPLVKTEIANGNSGATFSVNWASGDRQNIVITANTTLSFSGAVAGQTLTLWLVEDGTGGRTITLPTLKWPGGTPPTFTTTANAVNAIIVRYDGTSYFGQSAVGFA